MISYLVIELQTANDGTVSTLTYQFTDRNQAESKYHYIMSFAAVSELPLYAAMIITNTGETLMSGYYNHMPEPEPEPEPDPNEEPVGE